MKKLTITLLAAVLLTAGTVPSAQAAVEVTGGAYVGVYDKYLWRGFDLSGSKPVVQTGVDLSAKGFTLSYWSNLQTRDADSAGLESGEITETDIVLDYSTDLNDLLAVSVGNIFYNLDGLDDTNELYLGLTVNTLLSPNLTVYWDYDEAKGDGLFVTGSVGHTFTVTDQLGINLGALISYNYGSDYSLGTEEGHHGWHNYELSVSADYALTENLAISPSLLYSSGLSSAAKNNLDSEFLAGLNLGFTF
ncbi:MAG: hypothetical protein IH614_15630 [Desulfuromonadales bacterium]|nr:hypothetical protein [Desulfuromonadales bacterium]